MEGLSLLNSIASGWHIAKAGVSSCSRRLFAILLQNIPLKGHWAGDRIERLDSVCYFCVLEIEWDHTTILTWYSSDMRGNNAGLVTSLRWHRSGL